MNKKQYDLIEAKDKEELIILTNNAINSGWMINGAPNIIPNKITEFSPSLGRNYSMPTYIFFQSIVKGIKNDENF